MTDRNAKIPCEACGKFISKSNMSVHRRKCTKEPEKPTYVELEQQLEIQKVENQKQQYEIEQLKLELKTVSQQGTHQNANTINNITNSVTNVNHYYVLDNKGVRDGLNMEKIRTFGTENVDYIDKSKPLTTILKDIYCNDEHPENKTISHEYLNLQWIMFRFNDHILSLNLEHDREKIYVMLNMVCKNVEALLGQSYENFDEKLHATRELLRGLDNEVRELEEKHGVKKAYTMLPVWNSDQVKNMEARVWNPYMTDPKYCERVYGKQVFSN